MELKAPRFWHYMLRHLFRVESQRLREQLWERYPKSTALVWQLMLCGERAASELVMYNRLRQLCEHLDPALLVRTAERLCPAGKMRPKDITDFEEAVLHLTDARGQFIWLPEGGINDQRRTERTKAHRRA